VESPVAADPAEAAGSVGSGSRAGGVECVDAQAHGAITAAASAKRPTRRRTEPGVDGDSVDEGQMVA
jgi:hypothetical protein